jgi:hypothetical protein
MLTRIGLLLANLVVIGHLAWATLLLRDLLALQLFEVH